MKVEIQNLTFRYRRLFKQSEPLRDLTWSFGRGVTGLIGPNGGGKTTLIKAISTLAVPSQGEVFLDGRSTRRSVDRRELRTRIGLLPQEPTFVASMTCLETLSYISWSHGMGLKRRKIRAEEVLSQVGLSSKSNDPVGSLSGGQRRRLAIAATVVHDPDLIILDEPTVGLDPGARLEVRAMLRGLGRERTILLSAHLVEDIRYLCDEVGILANGHVAFSGKYHELERIIPDDRRENALGSTFELAYRELMHKMSEKELKTHNAGDD